MDHSPSAVRAHYAARAVVLLAFAVYIADLARRDALIYYLTPSLASWVKLCSLPMALMALFLLLQTAGARREALCGCEHRLPATPLRSALLYGWFALPLLLGFLLPDRALGSAAAARKGIELSYAGAADVHLSGDKEGNGRLPFTSLADRLEGQDEIVVEPALYSETVSALQLYSDRFEGNTVVITGFMHRDPLRPADNAFAVGRFLVHCCTADALPLGFPVYSETPISLPPDTWIEIKGRLELAPGGEGQTIRLRAESVKALTPPSNPYIYAAT